MVFLMDPNEKLADFSNIVLVNNTPYQRIVKKLIYLAHTRPNICHTVGIVSQFMHDHYEHHLTVVHQILHNLKAHRAQVLTSLQLFCDNKAAINIAHNLVQHNRAKHIKIDQYFINEKLNSGENCGSFVASNGQLANILTKIFLNCYLTTSNPS
ncbi:uncharacterized protein LOC110033481 [Phalaenopsis equestris]|uniref:uncharacterized protein LOC110033481 n=1 Tax=Phalaenopsis equestris TaxID=78828 RepID=UPI0009E52371|nr:uncharacterized protein LOC110033481 [Phalaenopsis equestris]